MYKKAKKEERNQILENTDLKWINTNIFLIKDFTSSKPYQEIFNDLKEKLTLLGYEVNKEFSSFLNKRNSIIINFHKGINRFFILFILNKNRIIEFFDFLDNNFVIRGYTGSNEWKRDRCIEFKVPMIGDLSYLDPKDGYWFSNTFCKFEIDEELRYQPEKR